jgi:hypothetical protein
LEFRKFGYKKYKSKRKGVERMDNNPENWNHEDWINFVVKAYKKINKSYEEFLGENFIEIIKLDLEYFSKNLEGLKKLLDSEKKYFVPEDKGFRRTL